MILPQTNGQKPLRKTLMLSRLTINTATMTRAEDTSTLEAIGSTLLKVATKRLGATTLQVISGSQAKPVINMILPAEQ